jgi:hypothetical protein
MDSWNANQRSRRREWEQRRGTGFFAGMSKQTAGAIAAHCAPECYSTPLVFQSKCQAFIFPSLMLHLACLSHSGVVSRPENVEPKAPLDRITSSLVTKVLKVKKKSKSIPVTDRRVLQSCEMVRIRYCLDNRLTHLF